MSNYLLTLSSLLFIVCLHKVTGVKLLASDIPRLRYNTCDLDLSPDVLNQLPHECLIVEEPLRDKLIQESILYKIFWEKLENYEAEVDEHYKKIKQEEPYAAAIPKKDWVLREKIYKVVDLLTCQNGTEVTYEQFADCMIIRRIEMSKIFDRLTSLV